MHIASNYYHCLVYSNNIQIIDTGPGDTSAGLLIAERFKAISKTDVGNGLECDILIKKFNLEMTNKNVKCLPEGGWLNCEVCDEILSYQFYFSIVGTFAYVHFAGC